MTPNDRYAKIREALDMGPTPGPWDGDDNSVSRLWSNESVGIREYIALPDSAEDSDPNPADMHWIAACDPDTIRELLAERDALAAENERLKEDRARFPDRPDDIGRMIEAHIGNLKAGKKSAEDLADKAFDRAFRAEAKLAEAIKVLDAIDRVNRGVDWCDQYEQARRWFAARKFLKENGNGE